MRLGIVRWLSVAACLGVAQRSGVAAAFFEGVGVDGKPVMEQARKRIEDIRRRTTHQSA